MMAFGVYPETSLADARHKREAARKLVAAGDPNPEYDPVIIRNNRPHVGGVFWQPADFSANSDGVIQPSAEWGRLWL